MKATVNPDWISAADMRKWCDIGTSTEHEWRKKYGLNICKMGDKTFYDRKEITQIMTENSTYALLKTA